MQRLGAWLLERRDGLDGSHAKARETEAIVGCVRDWLASKGADTSAAEGTFQPQDSGAGSFAIQSALDGARSWWRVALEEVTPRLRRVRTELSVTSGERLSVYVAVEAGSDAAVVAPDDAIDVRCPRIVRALLRLPGAWYHGASRVRPLTHLQGLAEGVELAEEIQRRERALPLVVVSHDFTGTGSNELGSQLADALAGIANVVDIDDEAAWGLTDELGRTFSCFGGAVRLYWPGFSTTDDRFLHPLWTAERIRSAAADRREAEMLLQRILRRRLFDAAAWSVTRPREIDAIRDAARDHDLAELRERAKRQGSEEIWEYADQLDKDNQRLRMENGELRDLIEDGEKRISGLESKTQALRGHLQAAKRNPASTTELEEEAGPEIIAPTSGEIRFYKKKYSTPSHDIMEQVGDCGCGNWESGHGGDKARKGVAKLEGRDDWQTLQHCASCTGGGACGGRS